MSIIIVHHLFFFFQEKEGIRSAQEYGGHGDVYKKKRLKSDERVGSGVLTIMDSLSSGLTLTSRGVSALTVSPAAAS